MQFSTVVAVRSMAVRRWAVGGRVSLLYGNEDEG
jgi:hypothetical protein